MTTVKLTRTERSLLEQAERKPSGALYAMTWYSTSSSIWHGDKFGMRTYGTRAVNALRSLCEKGLADNFRTSSNHEPNRSGFGSTNATEYGATITEAGREAIRVLQESTTL